MTCSANFPKNKKTVAADKGQTISRPSCLTVTVTRIFHRFASLHWLTPDYFRWHFSHSQNTFFRDMKRLRLFVLLFYHIPSRFTTKATGSKPLQNRYKRYSFGIVKVVLPYLSACGCWESGFVCQRRAAILSDKKESNFHKIPARPHGADL